MKKQLILPLLALLFLNLSHRPAETIRPGKDRAVFFLVEKYQNSKLTDLQNPVKNGKDLAATLKNRFGFETEVLENPTQGEIIAKLNELARLYTRNEDGKHPEDGQLFLFFSGHGMSQYENGFFLPADADPEAPWDKGMAYAIWRPFINQINCRHILVAIDACYSVRFDPDWQNKPDGLFKRPGEMTDSQRALTNFETYKARVFYTSDNKEDRTPDRSNFAKKLLEGLRAAAATDGYLTSMQLYANYVESATPTPRAGTFGDDEPSSAFLFYDLNGPTPVAPDKLSPDLAAWQTADKQNTKVAYRQYLRDFCPGGAFCEAATAKIEAIIKVDRQAFGTARTANTIDAYNQYLSKFPDGEYRTKATGVIDSLQTALYLHRDAMAWDNAVKEHTVEAYRKYQSEFPDGRASAEASARIAVLGDSSRVDDNMVFIQGGTFQMGSEDGYDNEKPLHAVTVGDFYLGKYEVTRALWLSVMNYDPLSASYYKGSDQEPVVGVSWDDVQEFLKKLNQQTGRQYRLPTEAEWEYAARGGAISRGYIYAGSNQLDDVAWNYYNKSPVGRLQANELGLYDMSGNVWEWCSDWYGENYYKNSPSVNPIGPRKGSGRVLRGGSFDSHKDCRVAHRSSLAPRYGDHDVGFRLARTP